MLSRILSAVLLVAVVLLSATTAEASTPTVPAMVLPNWLGGGTFFEACVLIGLSVVSFLGAWMLFKMDESVPGGAAGDRQNNFASSVFGVFILLVALLLLSLGVYTGIKAWRPTMGMTPEEIAAYDEKAAVEEACERVANLAHYYDVRVKPEIKCAPSKPQSGRFDVSIVSRNPKFKDDFKKHLADTPQKDWDIEITEVRYFVVGYEMEAVAINAIVTDPDNKEQSLEGDVRVPLALNKAQTKDLLQQIEMSLQADIKAAGVTLPGTEEIGALPSEPPTVDSEAPDPLSYSPREDGLRLRPAAE